MKIPILKDHEQELENIVGWIEPTEGGLKVSLTEPMTTAAIFETFGNIGIRINIFTRIANTGNDRMDFVTKEFFITHWSMGV